MQIDLAIQAHKIEKILDELHDITYYELGSNHKATYLVEQAIARNFAIFCDLTDYENRKEDDE